MRGFLNDTACKNHCRKYKSEVKQMPQNKSENITKTTQVSVLPDEIKDRKKRLVKFGSLAVFSLVIIIFFTMHMTIK